MKEKHYLMIINGGLGDAAAATPALMVMKLLGCQVHVYAMRGNAKRMEWFWRALGLQVHEDRALCGSVKYEAILGPTRHDVLEDRACGMRKKRVITPKSYRGTLGEIAMRLANAVGCSLEKLGEEDRKQEEEDKKQKIVTPRIPLVTQAMSPLAELAEEYRKFAPDYVLIGPGVSTRTEAQPKKWDRWEEVVDLCPKPIAFVGLKDAHAPWMKDRFGCVDYTGQTNKPEELFALLSRTRAYFGVDNGLGHLVALFGIPTVTVFTITNPSKFMPSGLQSVGFRDPKPQEVVDGAAAMFRKTEPSWAPNVAKMKGDAKDVFLSVIMTAHNEGPEVELTCADVFEKAGCKCEIIIANDGSTDWRPATIPKGVKVIETENGPLGVAPSRNLVIKEAKGNCFQFIDAHMRMAPNTPAKMAVEALRTGEVIVPQIGPMYSGGGWLTYGSLIEIKDGYVHSISRNKKPPGDRYSRCYSSWAPGYVISRKSFEKFNGWCPTLAGYGGTEQNFSTAAWFAGIDFKVDKEAIVWHKFRDRAHYRISASRKMLNLLTLSRVHFNIENFENYFKPEILSHLSNGVRVDWKETEEIARAANAYSRIKERTDAEFFLRVLNKQLPEWKLWAENAAAWWKLAQKELKIGYIWDEIRPVMRVVHDVKPKVFLEIGTGSGRSALMFGTQCLRGTKYITIDKSPGRTSTHVKNREVARKLLAEQGIEMIQIVRDSRSQGTVSRVRDLLGDEKVDMLFIDGGHQTDCVRTDFGLYSPFVRKGGVDLLHDVDNEREGVPPFWKKLRGENERTVTISEKKRQGFGLVFV